MHLRQQVTKDTLLHIDCMLHVVLLCCVFGLSEYCTFSAFLRPVNPSTVHYSSVQSSTSKYRLVQTSTAQYSLVEPSRVHYSPLDSSTTQYSSVADQYIRSSSLTSSHLLPYLPFQKPHSLLCHVLFI